ncbi:hypothetical protein ZIOFF_000617 [Zingiber officinale]|uniref:Pentatricopeptide repeat-containing protein n=2 Tax=Zingiber officinale TaxID=94328 RepID=A0A8J5II97_ZINOF|nr:hypothetical protein ZIOFF_000617 [Zingiber officinale]
MLNAFLEFGLVESAVQVFDQMPKRNCVTYNALLTGICHDTEGSRETGMLCHESDEEICVKEFWNGILWKAASLGVKFRAEPRPVWLREDLQRKGQVAPKSLASNKDFSSATADAAPGILEKEMGDDKRMDSRVPLKDVVVDCTRRWFQDALKEAKAGDVAMQVLVGQMYHVGYGVPVNEQKANAWITKASKYRSSAWKFSDKHPGYGPSDSESDVENIVVKS